MNIFSSSSLLRTLTCISILMLTAPASAEVSETITFDESSEFWPHEFCVRFQNNNAFDFTPTGGLSGGGIVPRDFITYWINYAQLDTYFVNKPGETFDLSMVFHFAPDIINEGFQQDAVNFFIRHPSYGESAIFLKVRPERLHVSHWFGGDYANYSTLSEGWYRIHLQFNNISGPLEDKFSLTASLISLGETGEDTPETVGEIVDFEFSNPFISRAPHLIPSILATRWGGCSIIDSVSLSGPDVIYAHLFSGLGERLRDTQITDCGTSDLYDRQTTSKAKLLLEKNKAPSSKARAKVSRKLSLTLKGRKKESFYYFSRNDSRYNDRVVVKHNKVSRSLTAKTYLVSPNGKRKNVSASAAGRGIKNNNLARGQRVRLRIDVRANPGGSGRAKATIKLKSRSSITSKVKTRNLVKISQRR